MEVLGYTPVTESPTGHQGASNGDRRSVIACMLTAIRPARDKKHGLNCGDAGARYWD